MKLRTHWRILSLLLTLTILLAGCVAAAPTGGAPAASGDQAAAPAAAEGPSGVLKIGLTTDIAAIEELLVMPVAVPGLATALALIVTYGSVGGFRTSWTFILVGHILFTLPFMVRSVLAVMMAVDLRTLEEAMVGADCFMGLSVAGAVSQKMVKSMAKKPIIFAMANPDPEITPEAVHEVRKDAIVATGRSDYPNQVNNVLGFPYIFRGALDVRARTINEEMKVAAARALAELAKQDVPDEVAAAYHGRRPKFGPDYIIPAPFDPRLISEIPPFVARAAMDSGVARRPIEDMQAYKHSLAQRLDPTAAMMQRVQTVVRRKPKCIVFAEGEEPSVIRAAYAFRELGLGNPVLIGREETVRANMAHVGVPDDAKLNIVNARLSEHNGLYADFLYKRLQRFGFLHRDAQRLVNLDRNVFGACMVAHGQADGMVTGVTRNYATALDDVLKVIDPAPRERVMGMSVILMKGRTLFISDTAVAEFPDPPELAQIVLQSAAMARQFGVTPRVALISHSTFGNPKMERSEKIRDAVTLLDRREDIDFEYEGEMNVDVALMPDMRELYPFSRLTDVANVLVMPALHSASIATSLLTTAGGATVIGPVLTGLAKPIQIAPLGGTVSDIVSYATLAAFQVAEQGAAKGS